MTEQEWQVCTDPQQMLEFLRGKASERKLRLFACGCCRQIWHLLEDKLSQQAVEAAEDYADGTGTASQMRKQYRIASKAAEAFFQTRKYHLAGAARAAADAVRTYPPHAAEHMTSAAQAAAGAAATDDKGETLFQVLLIRDIFGNPFCPASLNPAVLTWHNATVVRLAQAVYDERQMPSGTLDNGRLVVLADALEEAGCTDADILNHCRRQVEHVRGVLGGRFAAWEVLSGKKVPEAPWKSSIGFPHRFTRPFCLGPSCRQSVGYS